MSIIEKEQLLVDHFQESQYLYLLVTNILSLTKLRHQMFNKIATLSR